MSTEAVEIVKKEARRMRLPSRTRGAGEFDLRNAWQVAAGAILMPLGVIVILWAWYGAAHANIDQQQIPYMVSGGFIGLGLMIVGGLLFWAHWLYRIYDQADLQHRELLDAINRLGNGGAVATGAAAPSSARGERLVATGTGTTFHRPDCAVVAKRKGVRTITEAQAAKMQPCKICEPLVHA